MFSTHLGSNSSADSNPNRSIHVLSWKSVSKLRSIDSNDAEKNRSNYTAQTVVVAIKPDSSISINSTIAGGNHLTKWNTLEQ